MVESPGAGKTSISIGNPNPDMNKPAQDSEGAEEIGLQKFRGFMTSLILMGYAIDFATADATADFDLHERNLSDEVTAHGTQGKVRPQP